MNHYKNYLEEINKRKENGLNPKPIDNGELLSEIIDQIVDLNPVSYTHLTLPTILRV